MFINLPTVSLNVMHTIQSAYTRTLYNFASANMRDGVAQSVK